MQPPLSRLLCGAASWFLADARHGATGRVVLAVERDGSVTISSGGHALSAAPRTRPLPPRDVLEARDMTWTDGRIHWPEILGACSAWSLDVAAGSVSVHASGGPGLDHSTWDELPAGGRAPGSRLSLRFDPARVAGRLDEPETLFALHALAAAWPEARLVLKLPPEHVGWR